VWRRGQVIVRREVWHGRSWSGIPVIVLDDTPDHELDLWSTDGRTWNRKDEELLDQRVQEGRFTADEAVLIRAEAGRLEAELASRGPWWDRSWASWTPDPDWPRPALPGGWELA
jgi:hypothetical protein